MKLLKALGLSLVLTCATAIPALADDSCIPGEMHFPCSATSTDPTTPGETQAPPVADSVDVATLAEIALHSLLGF